MVNVQKLRCSGGRAPQFAAGLARMLRLYRCRFCFRRHRMLASVVAAQGRVGLQ
jgi:hypothetical protein